MDQTSMHHVSISAVMLSCHSTPVNLKNHISPHGHEVQTQDAKFKMLGTNGANLAMAWNAV
jgi:hypothetical protein